MSNGLDMKYFVLGPKSSDTVHAFASICAIIVYAVTIYSTSPERAQATYDWARDMLKERFPAVADEAISRLASGIVESNPEFRK